MATKEVPCAHNPSRKEITDKKRLVICCDGTWNDANGGTGPATNVSRLSGAVAHKCCSGMPQIVYYHAGAGTEASKIAHTLGGAFGIGVAQDIVESYRFVCDNFSPGDEIVIIGFSRGAFTARSVGAMVCALGFLNRSGLDKLPYIFSDYETWQDWWKTPFDRNKALCGFSVGTVKRLRRFKAASAKKGTGAQSPQAPRAVWEDWAEDKLQTELDAWRERTYREMQKMTQPGFDGKTVANLRAMAAAYRGLLRDFQYSLCERDKDSKYAWYLPVPGKVKAIGVWDTVGSLGIPEIPPFYHSGRGDKEIRFEGLDVHPNVEYAFHAIALDEWRTAFNCTLWGKRGNDKTHLRQVWFPGTHCNVGGGWEDQQIATIALAWMADQLTSVGVEFNKSEMTRIFYELRSDTTARKWGMGLLKNPNGSTSYPDWMWSYVAAPYRKWKHGTTDYLTRTPGDYKEDDLKEKLVNPNELIHPCVRIRYLYGGLNMDDLGPWTCRPLTERGYKLTRRTKPVLQDREPRIASAVAPHHTVHGSLIPYYDKRPEISTAGTDEHPFVKTEQPHEDDLHPIPDADPKAETSYWVWENETTKSVLPEEYIGMWERLYIKVNDKLVAWQEKTGQVPPAPKQGVWGSIKSVFGGEPEPFKPLAETLKDKYIPETYGYHDLITWQRGDTHERKRV